MALVTVQRSPTPSRSIEDELSDEVLDGVDCFSPTTSHKSQRQRCLSESYFVVRGAALILPRKECPPLKEGMDTTASTSAAGGEIQLHLGAMLKLLRSEDTLKMAVKLESILGGHTRYLAIVSTEGRQSNVESIILGIDYVDPQNTTIGLYLPIWTSTKINLVGDGRIEVKSGVGDIHIFKPVSVQAMWSAFQSLLKEQGLSRDPTFPGGLTHTWVEYYRLSVTSPEAFKSEWHHTYLENDDQTRIDMIERYKEKTPERLQAETMIRNQLRVIMHSVDLDEVTSKDIRTKLEEQVGRDLIEYKAFVDSEMLVILGQMDQPSQIFDYLYLGTEWNASNYDELKDKNIGYILNVTKEVDNFFPEHFVYKRVNVSDEESTELLRHWDETFTFISQAKAAEKAVLVHCKKGISRSSSTVIAYAMKEFEWDRDCTVEYVKKCRSCITPNKGFMNQLNEYQGILTASRHRCSGLFNAAKLTAGAGSKSEPMLNSHDNEPIDACRDRAESAANDVAGVCNVDDAGVDYRTSHTHPGLLVPSENIVRSSPVTKQTVDESAKRLTFDIKEKDTMDSNGFNARPPVVKHLKSVERRISMKGAEQVTLKHVQNMVLQPKRRSKLHPCDSSSGNSSDCSLSLTSSGDDEPPSTDWIKMRRNSKSSSGDSAVVDIEMNLSSSPVCAGENLEQNKEEKTPLTCHTSHVPPGQVTRFKQKYEETNAHKDKQATSEKSGSIKRKHKFLGGLFSRRESCSNQELNITGDGHNDKIEAVRKGTKSDLFETKHQPLKVSQPGQVKQQKEKLERRSQQDEKHITKICVTGNSKLNDHQRLTTRESTESPEKIVKKNKDKILELTAEECNNVRSLARRFETGSNSSRNSMGSERSKARFRRPSWRPRSLQRIMFREEDSTRKHKDWTRNKAHTT